MHGIGGRVHRDQRQRHHGGGQHHRHTLESHEAPRSDGGEKIGVDLYGSHLLCQAEIDTIRRTQGDASSKERLTDHRFI
ncbi:hypothetical protein MINT15_40930 [Saccharomonospora viridis]|uniref:Uncharacterized protein n=1 Tax=Saccharomonospora viridis TaxID=1852 RepID=A0A837D3L8_9PSEU|nr:hypothetical protein MINT15_40930 [Saccharomonospora viridis]